MTRRFGLFGCMGLLGVCLLAPWVALPSSPQDLLDDYLDRYERAESDRLSAAEGQPVRIAISLDVIERTDDDRYPLQAVVHVKCDGRAYDRPALRYDGRKRSWEWEPESTPAPPVNRPTSGPQ